MSQRRMASVVMNKQVNVLLILCLWFFAAGTCFSQTDSTITYLSADFDEVPQPEAAYYRVVRITDPKTGRGYQKDFFINGEKYEEINFSKVDSVRDGLSLNWHRNGQLEKRTMYVKNQVVGKSEAWFENGKLRWEQPHVNGKLEGDMNVFHPNGQRKRHEVYAQGKLVKGTCYDENEQEVPFYPFEVMPQFPGGDKEMFKYLAQSFRKGIKAHPKKVNGLVVFSFVVNQNGDVVQFRVVKTTHEFLGEIGRKVVQAMPKWSPGIQDGEKVPVKYTAPIRSEAF